jgi:hypothetical protein
VDILPTNGVFEWRDSGRGDLYQDASLRHVRLGNVRQFQILVTTEAFCPHARIFGFPPDEFHAQYGAKRRDIGRDHATRSAQPV